MRGFINLNLNTVLSIIIVMTNPNIIVVDDEVGITRITSSMLKMYKFPVEAFNNPEEALVNSKEKDISIAVVDYMMPEMQGNEFIRQFKLEHPNTHYIMLSAKKLNEEERKELFDNDVVFLAKPFKPRELIDAVNTALAKGAP
jgi:DNA-binding response OmpR family regulator